MRCENSPARAKLLTLFETVSRGRTDLSLGDFDDVQLDWIIRSGLGPACFHAAKENQENFTSRHWQSLKAADLTARWIGADHREAMTEIIDASCGYVPQLTLLKGISIAEEYYPEFHLRPMRDIDLLVPVESLAPMATLLHGLGYRQTSDAPHEAYDSHHHVMPFFHDERQVWVELHHRLISAKNHASHGRVFQPSHVSSQIKASMFQGRTVHRLSPELQVVYLAVHWAQDFKEVGGMIAALDLIFLLQKIGDSLRWENIFDWIDQSTALTYLHLLLSYLESRRLISLPDGILQRFYLGQPVFGNLTLKTIHKIVDQYMLDGASFGSLLSRRTLNIAWETLTLPIPSVCKLLVMPINLCMPSQFRIQ